MSTNASSSDLFLSLQTLGLPDSHIYPAFFFGLFTYITIMFFNMLVLVAIAVSKKLHKPMFILLFNLPISDMVGATAFFPHLVLSIVTKNRLISYPACITQAFMIHFYGTGNLLILSAMAYDRYIAICHPLTYNIIMSPHKLAKMIILVWLISFVIIGVLILLLAQLQLCRTHIIDLFCNNPSLLKLACSGTRVNSLYGLAGIVFLQGGSLLILVYTYAQILYTCLVTNQSDARRKAIQTCGSHLVVFLLLQINTLFTLTAHRVNNTSPYLRRALGVSILIFPPFLDPIIYGLKTKELRQAVIVFLRRNRI
ncbi:putative gustatory receptor clone PTE01 [Sphaeramia orbicularis]|uniref:Olfactory receptor n=1 Tax=Sphaeramia orbicularis TaxID=375764 RepID=A0A672ZGA9_9TELE|nr:putative gustatory receptor clone PTE01 [Sphaeramia orbicularis]